MIPFEYRDPRLARLRWLALVGLAALASIASFFPYAATVRDPAAAGLAEPVLFFASVTVFLLAVAGYARARWNEERARERASDGADD